jgi:PAS domain S-box-containing protein
MDKKWPILAGTTVLYGVFVVAGHRSLGDIVFAASVLPALAAGWAFGTSIGFISGLALGVLNLLVLLGFGYDAASLRTSIVGGCLVTLAGGFSGYVSRLARRLQANVDDLHRMQTKLIDAIERLDRAQEIARVGDFSVTLRAGTIRDPHLSKEAARIFGGKRRGSGSAESLEDFLALLRPDDREKARAALREAARADAAQASEEFVLNDGAERWLHVISRSERLPDGDVRIVGTVQDVTERKRHEQELLAKNAELKKLTDLMVGRELAIAKLKDEVSSLKRELSKRE